jgi:hypothetical protein
MSYENRILQQRIGRSEKFCRRIAAVSALAICVFAVPAFAAQDQQEQQNEPFRPFGSAGDPQSPPPSYQQVPPTLTLPAGTVITVRVSQLLSSDENRTGDVFDAVLQQPVVVDGWVVARKGQTVLGRVAVAEKARRGGGGVSQLGVGLSQLILVDGQQLPIRTQLLRSSGTSTSGRDAATVGITTATGAAIGAVAGEGKGAGIGAAVGAAAGIIGVLLTPGRPTVIPPETQLTFQLESPLTISTERSQQAFQPVSPQDFHSQDYDYYRETPRYGPRRVTGPVPYAPPPYYWNDYYYGGYYPSWGFAPAPFFGFYGTYRARPGFVTIRPRFGIMGRGRFRR